jgi:hypothetical protein
MEETDVHPSSYKQNLLQDIIGFAEATIYMYPELGDGPLIINNEVCCKYYNKATV